MKTSEQSNFKLLSSTPAPQLPGLVSIQAVSANPEGLDVTMFHQSAGEAKYWGDTLSSLGSFRSFLLRQDGDEKFVEAYDANFNYEGDIGDYPPTLYTHAPAEGDSMPNHRAGVLAEVRATLMNEDITVLAQADMRAEGSAAERSNLWVMLRKMMGEGGRDDLKHLFLVETKQAGFRSMALCADLTRVSAKLQDTFLDRSGYLNKAWPLVENHFLDGFAACLAVERRKYALEVLQGCADAAGFKQSLKAALLTKWTVASGGKRYQLARHLAETLYSDIAYAPAVTEVFLRSGIDGKGTAVVKDFKALLTA